MILVSPPHLNVLFEGTRTPAHQTVCLANMELMQYEIFVVESVREEERLTE